MPVLNPSERYDALHAILISQQIKHTVGGNTQLKAAYENFCTTIDRLNRLGFSQDFLATAMEKVVQYLRRAPGMSRDVFNQHAEDIAKSALKYEQRPSYWGMTLQFLAVTTLIVSIASMVCFGLLGFVVGLVGVALSFFLNNLASREKYSVSSMNLGEEMKKIGDIRFFSDADGDAETSEQNGLTETLERELGL